MEINLTSENFEKEVLKSNKPVIIDFFAIWCGPCQMLAPVISKIAEEYKERVKVCKVNIDEEQELAIKYNIVSIPTIIIFKDGKITDTSVGFATKSELERKINTLLIKEKD